MFGLFLILATGLLWSGIGIILGMSSRRSIEPFSFMAMGSGLAALASWILLVDWEKIDAQRLSHNIELIVVMGCAGIAGALGMLCLQRSMAAGAAGWVVGQSAMMIPFLYGLIILGESIQIFGICGMLTIFASLLAFSLIRPKAVDQSNRVPSRLWFVYALLAFFLLGIQQVFSSLPSTWMKWSDDAHLRIPLLLSFSFSTIVIICIMLRVRPKKEGLIYAVFYAFFGVGGQILLFLALDQLKIEGRLSFAFPLAIGTSITIVAFWDIVVWKCARDPLRILGMLLGVMGTVFLAL